MAAEPLPSDPTKNDVAESVDSAAEPIDAAAAAACPDSNPESASTAPVNRLDPDLEPEHLDGKVPRRYKVFGVLCIILGVLVLVSALLINLYVAWALFNDPDSLTLADSPVATMVVTVLLIAVVVVNAGVLVFLGQSLLRNKRRHAAQMCNALIVFSVADILLEVMVNGITVQLLRPIGEIIFLVVLSTTLDPALSDERELQYKLRLMEDRDDAREGTLGRDETGRGYIELNFFNLFWVFFTCSIAGLYIELVYHMVVVDPGVYQDRAGLLFGPFSPIYGVGAVILTIALNHLYDDNPVLIFLASAIIGGAFECFVSWFMEMAFGATAWDYTGNTIFGVPDPIAIMCDGRTATSYAIMWGLLGLVWIKLFLPYLLRLINMIPWKWRYTLTAVVAAFMLVDAIMTLQSLDCWFERVSGQPVETDVQVFYAEHFDDEYMANRFQTMTIDPDSSSRMDDSEIETVELDGAA